MKETTNVATGYLCHCLRITAARFEEMLEETPEPTFTALKRDHGIGSLCSSCEYEAKGVIEEYLLLHPDRAKASGGPRGLSAELGYAWREIKKRIRSAAQMDVGRVYHTGVFFMRRDGLESHLVVSNLGFPEHPHNVNGARVTFRASLYGGDGVQMGTSQPIHVPTGETIELSPAELFPDATGNFVGGLYVDFYPLRQTGSLRPYGVMVNTSQEFRARCHYHDKFALFRDPGYFQNTSPFEPGQACWMAIANCQPRAYESDACVKIGGERFSARLRLGPMGAQWIKLEDLFPQVMRIPEAERSPALMWLENPQHVMVYFYWFNAAAGTWMGQHH